MFQPRFLFHLLALLPVTALLLGGCTKPPEALAVELLFDDVSALEEGGYTYVRAEALAGGHVVLAQQAEVYATPRTTPVFWVDQHRAWLVNTKAQELAPEHEVAPQEVFDLLDPKLFPDLFQDAFKEMLRAPLDLDGNPLRPPGSEAVDLSTGTGGPASGSP